MPSLPDLRRSDRHEGSFDKDIPGIPSSTLCITQDGREVRVEYVAYENDVEVSRSVYEGTLTHWFPTARRAFVRLRGQDARMAIDADTGWYRFDLDPAALEAEGIACERFDEGAA